MKPPTLRNLRFLTTCAVGFTVSSITFAQHTVDNLNAFFADAQILSGPEMVDCTLSGGAQSTCFKITVKPEPTTYTAGPWCPTHIDQTAEAGGIWLEGGQVYDVDGTFIQNLAVFYKDDSWQLFDKQTGEINVTDTQVSCEAAARPDVAEEFQNHCVKCELSYMSNEASMTYTIPVIPVGAEEVGRTNGGSGIANNGVRLDGPAPVEAIKAAYTIAAFDDCGGHVNPNVGYHYHAVTDCLHEDHSHDAAGHAKQIGIAMDGHAIHLHDEKIVVELDACNGHATNDEGYHYHAGSVGSNAILGCLTAQTGCSSSDRNAACDASQVIRRGPRPDRNGDTDERPNRPQPED